MPARANSPYRCSEPPPTTRSSDAPDVARGVHSGSAAGGAVGGADLVLCHINPFSGLVHAVGHAWAHDEIGAGRTVDLYCKLRFGRHTFKTDERLLAAVQRVADELGCPGQRFQLYHLLSDSENERTLHLQLHRESMVRGETVAEY